MTVCLAMMAKAPAEVVLRAVESALPYVDSLCLVVEPGSPLAHVSFPVETRIVSQPWIGYAATRTATLRHAEQDADWIVMVDAYSTVSGTLPSLEDSKADAYEVTVEDRKSRWRWMRPWHLLRARRGFSWTGDIHETLTIPDGAVVKPWRHFVVHVEASPKVAGKTRTYDGDADILAAECAKDPSNTRAAFYKAQSLKDAGRYREAFDAFAARSHMRHGSNEETWWAALWCARLARFVGEDVVPLYLRAHEMAPHRAEPLAGLEHHYRNIGRHNLAATFGQLAASKPYPVDAKLFVDLNAYSDEALQAAGIAA